MKKIKFIVNVLVVVMAFCLLLACSSGGGDKDKDIDSDVPTMGVKILSTASITFDTISGADIYEVGVDEIGRAHV